MRTSRLVLMLFLYVSLDLANPLMPGAVSLEAGFVKAAGAERQRAASHRQIGASLPGRREAVAAPRPPRPRAAGSRAAWLAPLRRDRVLPVEPVSASDDH
jgi:hypothetical protein